MTWSQIHAVAKGLLEANLRVKHSLTLCLIMPLIHLCVLYWSQPHSGPEVEGARMLSATLQWGVLLLFATNLGLQTLRWQLEEGYASHIMLLVSSRAWLLGNFVANLYHVAFHTLACVFTLLIDAAIRGQLTATPMTHWGIFYINIWLSLACVVALGSTWSLWLPKSSGFVLNSIIAATWLGLIKDPLTYPLPPLELLDPKGLLVHAGSNASYRTNPYAWLLLISGTVLYSIGSATAVTQKRIFALLKR